jgi:hypothetical protein
LIGFWAGQGEKGGRDCGKTKAGKKPMPPRKRKSAARAAPKKRNNKRRRRVPAASINEPTSPVPDDEESVPDSDSENKEKLEAEEPMNTADVMRKMEMLCEFPLRPEEYFTQRCKEIAVCEKGSILLREIFGIPPVKSDLPAQTDNPPKATASNPVASTIYLPKELSDICVSYYEEDVETMIHHTCTEFRIFSNGKVIKRLREQIPCAELEVLISGMNARGPSYRWWFLLRLHVPLFIPMDDSIMRSDGSHCRLFDNCGKEVAGMCFNIQMNAPRIGVRQVSRRRELKWDYLMDSIPHPDLIGPCLNTSTLTLEKLNACATELEIRTNEGQEKWLSFLFDLHRSYAAIRLWISELTTFSTYIQHDPEWAQNESILHWNRFYRNYLCGDPIGATIEHKEGKVQRAYLSYD